MTTSRSILIVANPTSGRGRGARTALAVGAELEARGLTVTIHHTHASGDAERRVRGVVSGGGDRPDCVVACGGDGTMQEVAHALADMREPGRDEHPTMALAPAGRCNDFARALGVQTQPNAIAQIIAEGEPTAIDLGCVNGRHFCTVATVGIDAEISRHVDRMRMPLTGTPAYLYGALCVLARYRPRNLIIEGDFGVIDEPVFLASSANTSSYGGSIPIAPEAVPTDGKLDVCVIEFMSKLKALAMVPAVLRGRHAGRRAVTFQRTRMLTITAPQPLEVWADGECVARTPVTIQAVPSAIRVMLPRANAAGA